MLEAKTHLDVLGVKTLARIVKFSDKYTGQKYGKPTLKINKTQIKKVV